MPSCEIPATEKKTHSGSPTFMVDLNQNNIRSRNEFLASSSKGIIQEAQGTFRIQEPQISRRLFMREGNCAGCKKKILAMGRHDHTRASEKFSFVKEKFIFSRAPPHLSVSLAIRERSRASNGAERSAASERHDGGGTFLSERSNINSSRSYTPE